MNEPIDGKFQFFAEHVTKKTTHSHLDGIVFLAQDDCVPATLRFYRQECERHGAGTLQLKGVDRLIEQVDRWRAAHPERCKVPDVEAGDEAAALGVQEG